MPTVHNLAADVSAFTANVSLVPGDRTVLVDPGANFDVVSRIRGHVEDLDAIVLTHTHVDHVGNVADVKDTFDVRAWGFDPDNPVVDESIDDEDRIRIGDHEYLALHTPGHKNDHLCFYSETAGVLFAGDLVFQNGGFGRTDLEEGDRNQLVESIDRLLSVLDDDLEAMHVGHGPSVYERPIDHVEMAARMARTY